MYSCVGNPVTINDWIITKSLQIYNAINQIWKSEENLHAATC